MNAILPRSFTRPLFRAGLTAQAAPSIFKIIERNTPLFAFLRNEQLNTKRSLKKARRRVAAARRNAPSPAEKASPPAL